MSTQAPPPCVGLWPHPAGSIPQPEVSSPPSTFSAHNSHLVWASGNHAYLSGGPGVPHYPPPFISLPVPAPLYTAPSLKPPTSPSLQVPSVSHLDSVSNASQSQIPFFIGSFRSFIHVSLLFAHIFEIYVFNRKLAGNEGADMSLFSN